MIEVLPHTSKPENGDISLMGTPEIRYRTGKWVSSHFA